MALAAILVCCMGTFAWAEGGDGGSGVIEPVSPEQFGSKLQGLGDMLYDATSPVADTIAKISLAIAGLLLIVLIVSGAATGTGAIIATAMSSTSSTTIGFFIFRSLCTYITQLPFWFLLSPIRAAPAVLVQR